MKRVPLENVCRNPRCGEPLGARVLIRLCPSCRVAAWLGSAAGTFVAGVVTFAIYFIRGWLS